MNNTLKSVLEFCIIQLQVLKERDTDLRKQLLNCKIQKEYLESVINDLKIDEEHSKE
tara:strand:- start:21 stop:191 length:171 start_codon:yes stop_codon:yes gene_type:complete